ncbi:MAG: tetratricopeptide repeat protein [Myxococcales bacterium]|nr:tetratricopeptide repeat protein [Myxococcales bacterium]
MDGRLITAVGLAVLLSGCALFRARKDAQELRFDPELVEGDLQLEKLNDEELFAAGSSFFAALDYKQAARYFGRLADFHPNSPHRRAALYNAGLSLQRLRSWEEAYMRFSELSDPQRGTGDALDASFRVAETLYHLGRYDDASALLEVIAKRSDLPAARRIEAQVQKGICEMEAGRSEDAERSLRRAVVAYQDLEEKDQVDDYYPAQAQFFLGEIFRLHYELVTLDPDKGVDELARDLEYKAELLLSAQGHYLRSIRIGNGYWATASGAQIGGLYENLYHHMVNSPAPRELHAEEAEVYRQELRKKIRVLITKAISIYERTLETAERIGAINPFVVRTRESLQKMKDLLLADARAEEEAAPSEPTPPGPPGSQARVSSGPPSS